MERYAVFLTVGGATGTTEVRDKPSEGTMSQFDLCDGRMMLNDLGLDKSDTDRRNSARTPVFMLVHVGDGKSPMWAHDVGMGGLLCRTEALRFPGQYLDVRFTLPASQTEFKVGVQVMSIDEASDGKVTLGLRFCRPSDQLTMVLYRFLDQRRRLWDDIPAPEGPLPSLLERGRSDDRPFQEMLVDAYAAMRTKEINDPEFFARGPSRDLQALGRLLGESGNFSERKL